MKGKSSDPVLRLISKVLTDPRVGPDLRDRLQKARRELETVARCGKVDRRRVFRAVEMVATVLAEIVEQQAAQG